MTHAKARALTPPPYTHTTRTEPTDCPGVAAAVLDIGAALTNATKGGTITALITLDCAG